MKINKWHFDWEGLLRELRGNRSTQATTIDVSALAPYGYGSPLGEALLGQTKVSTLCLELANLFHPLDTADGLAPLFTFLSTSTSLRVVRLDMSQHSDVVNFFEPMLSAICDNPNICDLTLHHNMIVHCESMVHLLKTTNSLQCLSLKLYDCDRVLSGLRSHAVLHTLSISFDKDCKVRCSSLGQLLQGLSALRHLTLADVAFDGETMAQLLLGLSNFGDSVICLYMHFCSFDKNAMEKFATFMPTVDNGHVTTTPIHTLSLNYPKSSDDHNFGEAVAAMCTRISPLRFLKIGFGHRREQLGIFLGCLIKNSPTQMQNFALYRGLDEAETSLLSCFIQSEVHLKELSICKTNGELQEKFAQSLRHNGSIRHASLYDTELSQLYGKRNHMIPSLLGKDVSRMANLPLFPILFAVSRAARSLAPNNLLIGLLTSRHFIGPRAAKYREH
jgi:hypothetical protein